MTKPNRRPLAYSTSEDPTCKYLSKDVPGVIYIDRQKAEIRLNELVKGIFCKRVIQQKSGEMNIDLPIVWDNTMVLSIGNLSEKEIAKLYEIELGSTARYPTSQRIQCHWGCQSYNQPGNGPSIEFERIYIALRNPLRALDSGTLILKSPVRELGLGGGDDHTWS